MACPPETSSATGIASLLVEVLVTLFMFGLLFYFVRRVRKQWGTACGSRGWWSWTSGDSRQVKAPLLGTRGREETPAKETGHARTPAGGASARLRE